MFQFDLVAYAPKTAREWWKYIPADTGPVLGAAQELLGPGATNISVCPSADFTGRDGTVGIAICGPILFVMWSGRPDSALHWDRLSGNEMHDRFRLGVYPSSDGLEAHWTGPDGSTRRHVSISGGEIVTDLGDARVLDEDAWTDPRLKVMDGQRLTKAQINVLLSSASDDDVEVYDGRRYVRTRDRAIIRHARIVYTDRLNQRWVAIDQSGPVNTLLDPLRRPVNSSNIDRLGEELLAAWFRLDVASVPLRTFPWQADSSMRSLGDALRAIREDRPTFLGLIAKAGEAEAVTQLSRHYGMSEDDAIRLLQLPLRSFL